ncbi:MAG TPA: formylglycine-generating enzyme family protein [Kofleriaceae bacterium]|nr:formylglycine-generating enzyme family protein [Kofleriaceae bacterium]
MRTASMMLLGVAVLGCGAVSRGDGDDGDGAGGDGGAGGCRIAGVSYGDGDGHPDDPCLMCDAAASASEWSPNDGAVCDDGKYCTGEDSCAGGTCSVHSGAPCLLCDEGGETCTRNLLVAVAPGTFQMGSPVDEVGRESNFVDETQHEVTLTRGFEMTATEITQGQFEALFSYNPSQFSACGSQCPVEAINFYEALAYANLASEEQGLPPCYQLTDIGCGDATAGSAPDYCRENGFIASATVALTAETPYDCAGFRLPTEAEREWAARAGTTQAFSNGRPLDEEHIDCATPFHLTQVAWYCGNAGGTTHAVGTRDANPWGLFDMHGNVHEWTWDLYGEFPTRAVTDPLGVEDGPERTYRGGAFGDSARYARSAMRASMEPGSRYPGNLGLRLVRTARSAR